MSLSKEEMGTEHVFLCDLVLKSLFRCLSTPELHLIAAKVNRKWNAEASRLARQERLILLNNKNIFRYCDMINEGGPPHHKICIDITSNDSETSIPILIEENKGLEQANKLISTVSKIGKYIEEMKLASSRAGETSSMTIQPYVFKKLIISCPNLTRLHLAVPGRISLDPVSPRYSFRTRLKTSRRREKLCFKNLQSLRLATDSENKFWMLMEFLKHAPNLQKITWGDGTMTFKLEHLRAIKTMNQNFYEKLCYFSFDKLDEKVSNFLTTNPVTNLKKLVLTNELRILSAASLLRCYANSLVHVYLNVGLIWKNLEYEGVQLWDPPLLKLPPMHSLQELHFNYYALDWENPRWPIIKFWTCETMMEFSKLRKFTVYFGAIEQRTIETILSATFEDIPAHPTFTKIQEIEGRFMARIRNSNPHLETVIRTYFPNLVYNFPYENFK